MALSNKKFYAGIGRQMSRNDKDSTVFEFGPRHRRKYRLERQEYRRLYTKALRNEGKDALQEAVTDALQNQQ